MASKYGAEARSIADAHSLPGPQTRRIEQTLRDVAAAAGDEIAADLVAWAREQSKCVPFDLRRRAIMEHGLERTDFEYYRRKKGVGMGGE